MKFFCSGTELANASNIVSKAVAVNKNIPILEGINIKAIGKNVTLSAFNQELYIEKTIPADIYEEGEIIVGGKMFNDCANKISGVEKVCIEKGFDQKITITFNKSNMELNYFESSSFASFGNYNEENSCYVKEKDLKELFERAIFCVSASGDTRLLLKSCCIEVYDGIIEAVCLDGSRLAISKKPVKFEKGHIKCVVLGKIISDIIKILSDTEEEVKVINEKKSLIIDLGHTKIKTTLIESDTHNYRNNLPKVENYEIIVNKDELEGSLNRAAIISREGATNHVEISVSNNVLNIYCKNEKGKTSENLDCKCTGDDIRIGINNKFLSDAIARIKEDYVKIVIEDARKPILVKRVDEEDYCCIIMPVRLM